MTDAITLAIEALESERDDLRSQVESLNVGFNNCQKERDALQAQLAAAQGQQPSAPEGWKLVPIEPTKEMICAPPNAWPADAKVTWAAMLAASPKLGAA